MLFPQVPEDLAAETREALQGLLEQFTSTAADLIADMRRPVEERTIDIGDMSAGDLMEALKTAAADRKRIEDHLAGLDTAEQNFLTDLSAVAGELGVEPQALAAEGESAPDGEPAPEGEPEPAPDADEPVAVAEPVAAEPALAVADAEPVVEPEPTPEPTRSLAIPRGPSRLEPRPTVDADTPNVLVATAGLGSIKVREGTPLARSDFSEAIRDLAQRLGPVKHVRGGTEDKFPVARVDFNFPDEFTLGHGGEDELDKIRAVAWQFLGLPEGASPDDPEIFQAAGGICAPPTPFYDVPSFASRERPVRGALPSFTAVRGGVSLPSVSTIDRADEGVTVIEESADAQGGTFSAKSCRRVECATWTETFIGIISHCLEVGTLNARTWPEGIALEEDNQMAAHAGIAEARLLNRIKALSIEPSSYGQPYNGVHGFIYAIARAKAAIRNRLRAASGATYTALLPEWVQEFLVADLAAQSQNDDRYVSLAAVQRFFDQLGVTPVWYKDSPTTGPTQNFTAEVAATPLDDFPADVQWGLYINGTFLHLDGGSLELGLVRDSTLNGQNDHQLFGETFENVARVGPEQSALWLTNAICPSGVFPPAASAALTC